MTMRIQEVGLYIKLDVRLRVKSAMQFLKLSYQPKFHRQNRSTTQTFSFFIRNFSMLRTLTLKCGSHQSLDKQDFTVLEHAKTNLYIDIPISTGRSPSLVLSASAKTISS